MSKLIHVRISPESHKDLQRAASADSRTIAQMARVLLEAGISERKALNYANGVYPLPKNNPARTRP